MDRVWSFWICRKLETDEEALAIIPGSEMESPVEVECEHDGDDMKEGSYDMCEVQISIFSCLKISFCARDSCPR